MIQPLSAIVATDRQERDMTNSDAGFHDEYQRAIARSDRAWNAFQAAREEHGEAAVETDLARLAVVATTEAELAAYDLLKGNS